MLYENFVKRQKISMSVILSYKYFWTFESGIPFMIRYFERERLFYRREKKECVQKFKKYTYIFTHVDYKVFQIF